MYGLNLTQMEHIWLDTALGRRQRITGRRAEEFRRYIINEMWQAALQGWVVEIPCYEPFESLTEDELHTD